MAMFNRSPLQTTETSPRLYTVCPRPLEPTTSVSSTNKPRKFSTLNTNGRVHKRKTKRITETKKKGRKQIQRNLSTAEVAVHSAQCILECGDGYYYCRLCKTAHHINELKVHLLSQCHIRGLHNVMDSHYCIDCGVKCNSVYSLNDHISGRKHQTKRILGEPVDKLFIPNLLGCQADEMDRTYKEAINTLKKSDKPVLGLEYGMVISNVSRGVVISRYECRLCGEEFELLVKWREHFQCYSHTLRVLEYDYNVQFRNVALCDVNTRSVVVTEMARSIETIYGRSINAVGYEVVKGEEPESKPSTGSNARISKRKRTHDERDNEGGVNEVDGVVKQSKPTFFSMSGTLFDAKKVPHPSDGCGPSSVKRDLLSTIGNCKDINHLQEIMATLVRNEQDADTVLQLNSVLSQALWSYRQWVLGHE